MNNNITINNNKLVNGLEESIKFILKFYKGVDYKLDYNKMANYFDNDVLQIIEKIASNNDLIVVECNNVTIDEVKDFKHPVIINISSLPNVIELAVCFRFDEKLGFVINDYRYGKYFASDNGMKFLWNDNRCIAFIN